MNFKYYSLKEQARIYYNKYSEIRKVYSRKAFLKTLLGKLKFKLFPKCPEEVFREVCQFNGATVEYAFKRATVERESFGDTFTSKPRKTEAEIRSAYTETDVWLYSQVYYHRHSTWYHILEKIPRNGSLCEYGCGMACSSDWLSKKRQDIRITLADIPSVTWEFVKWKYKKTPQVTLAEIDLGKGGLPLTEQYDVITCLDVLEHTVNPIELVEHLITHLKQKGVLFIDFNPSYTSGEPANLKEAEKQRPEVLQLLKRSLLCIRPITPDKRGLYQKV